MGTGVGSRLPHFPEFPMLKREISEPQSNLSSSSFPSRPSPNKSLFEAHKRREQALGCSAFLLLALGESPRTSALFGRLRKRAAIEALRLISAACLLSVFFLPGLPRSRPSIFLFAWSYSHSHSRTGDHMDEDMSPRSGCLGRMLCASRWGVGSMVGCRW
jgi:hypothetical protein